MTVDFAAPSYRASGSDLTIAISPLGLVELADEEFEVHGPRLNRYAHNWAWYLGHHWGYRREVGEPQLTFNYVRRFADYLNNFLFGRGVQFGSPKATSAIIPKLLERVWAVDNDKGKILWEMGNQGGVSGDCFVKVAYEEPWYSGMDGQTGQPIPGVMQRYHPGRVRVLVLNSSFCFPEFHPHDKNRLLRFKLKYRFWGTSAEGTRQVFTYTELITDTVIEEYINDQLLEGSPRPNPLGKIPVTHIAHNAVSGSPWGLSDIHDVLSLNREYNEKATDISDIINYHAAPVTVITGAKAQQLEKGPKKVWSGLPKDAQVYNLELGANLQGPLEYMALLKTAMHEMTGVHENALGREQAVSNTSGVALAIEYMSLMQVYNQHKIQYEAGLKSINEDVILTLAVKEPESLQWNPEVDSDELKPFQLPVLDPEDPVTYLTTVYWPPPLPVDTVNKLQEELAKQQMGLQSKRGTLHEMGEPFPDDKMEEINQELQDDLIDQGVLDLKRALIMRLIMELTGMAPDGVPAAPGEPGGPPAQDGDGQSVKSAGGPNVTSAGGSAAPSMIDDPAMLAALGMEDVDRQKILSTLVQRAFNQTVPKRMPEPTDPNN
jgi:hypothetical protein